MKKRNLHNEKKWMKIYDFLTLLVVGTVMGILFFHKIDIGYQLYITSIGAYVILIFGFMSALEEYKIMVTEFYEKTVIFCLSAIYSWILVSLVDIIVLGSSRMLVIHLIFAAAFAIALLAENYIAHKVFHNSKRYEKQKLLIIETDGQNFMRMKRIKYGTLANYDSWYEQIDTEDHEALMTLLDENLPYFDAICLLDRLKGSAYDLIVEKAMDLNKELYIVPRITDIGMSSAETLRLDDILTLYMPNFTISGASLLLKRITDIVFAVVGLAIAAIPIAVIALIIKLTSEGPVFYKQVRLTKNKREFEIYKFRTMVVNAELLSGPVFAQKNDPRITKVGRFLRACRLDELPQLINILKGDMSLVGPRPERPHFSELFSKEIENYDYRFKVQAGLTALSHVYGRYSTYIHDRSCYDLMYITNYSYLLDLKILLLTSKTIFLKSSAEGEDEFKVNDGNKESKTFVQGGSIR